MQTGRTSCEPPRTTTVAALESVTVDSFDGLTLCNVLDGTPPSYRARLLAAVRRAGTARARAVLRSFADPSQPLARQPREPRNRFMLWGCVDVVEAQPAPSPSRSQAGHGPQDLRFK